MSEIMNCPFCNGRAIMRGRFINGVANVKHYRLECVDCHASFLNWNKNTSKAIAAWNRRAQPENEPLTCEGCVDKGQYENEVEYGYPSPCTRCKRRSPDNYRRKPERSDG